MENKLDINDPQFMKALLLDLMPALESLQGQVEALTAATVLALQQVDSASPFAAHVRAALQEAQQSSETLEPAPHPAHIAGLRVTMTRLLQALEPRAQARAH